MSLFVIQALHYTNAESSTVAQYATNLLIHQEQFRTVTAKHLHPKLLNDFTGVAITLSDGILNDVRFIYEKYPSLRFKGFDATTLSLDSQAAAAFEVYGNCAIEVGKNAHLTARVLRKQAYDSLEAIVHHIYDQADHGNPEAAAAKSMLEKNYQQVTQQVERSQAKAERAYEEGAADLQTVLRRLDDAMKTIENQNKVIAQLQHEQAMHRTFVTPPSAPKADPQGDERKINRAK